MGTASSWYFKLNFDGASFGNPGPAGVGGLCRNGEGVVQRAFFGPIRVCDASEAEVMAVFYGIKKISGDFLDKVIIKGDILNVIRWLKGGVVPPWRFLPFIDEIHEIISGSTAVLKHVRRAANEKADLLAKRGVNSDSLQWFDLLPPRSAMSCSVDVVYFLFLLSYLVICSIGLAHLGLPFPF
ncbi:uncharacterized protein LOC143865261 [Tasmannia lanceolata]|uniref:uncharacterized protein LOC143865261 n=1 Tax=Tasmannia lanceolata TaxID=3420 RepID=UPI00406452A2